MKKLSIIALALVLCLCLCGCDFLTNTVDYSKLDKMSKRTYNVVKLTVTTTTDGETLTSTFVTTTEGDDQTVKFTLEQLATLDIDTVPTSYKTKVEGSAKFRYGIPVDEETASMPEGYVLSTVSASKMEFKYANFSKATMTSTHFTANVTNPQAFMKDSNLVCSNMKIVAQYANSLFQNITVTYETDGAKTELYYEFAK